MYPYCKVLPTLSIAALLWNPKCIHILLWSRELSASMSTEAGVGHTKGRPVSVCHYSGHGLGV